MRLHDLIQKYGSPLEVQDMDANGNGVRIFIDHDPGTGVVNWGYKAENLIFDTTLKDLISHDDWVVVLDER